MARGSLIHHTRGQIWTRFDIIGYLATYDEVREILISNIPLYHHVRWWVGGQTKFLAKTKSISVLLDTNLGHFCLSTVINLEFSCSVSGKFDRNM